jgi:hypothetical protein
VTRLHLSDSFHVMANDLTEADWSHVLRRAFEVPDIVSDGYALEAIQQWVKAHLETSELSDAEKQKLAEELPAAVVAFAASGGLDYYLVGSLAQFLPTPTSPAAEAVLQSAYPNLTVDTTESAQAQLTVVGEMVERMIDYVEKHKFFRNPA